jgi:phosphoribosylanthranilate isomerase
LIKICGLTCLSDAQLAVAAGADAIGFVFAASPRQVTVEQVAAITRHLPQGPLRVGVFVNASVSELMAAVRTARLDVVQLHGEEPVEIAHELQGVAAVWKVIPMQPDEDAPAVELMRAWQPWVDAFLLDTALPGQRGGTGKTFAWHRVPALRQALNRDTPVLVAGGLRPENVGEAIQTACAWGVDVSSGVEAAPGRKDPDRLRWLVQAARAAFRLPPAC